METTVQVSGIGETDFCFADFCSCGMAEVELWTREGKFRRVVGRVWNCRGRIWVASAGTSGYDTIPGEYKTKKAAVAALESYLRKGVA